MTTSNKSKLNIYPKRANNLLGYYLLLVLVCFVWGGTPASGRTLVQQVSPFLITGMRFVCVGAILGLWLYLVDGKKALYVSKHNLLILVFMAILGIGLHNTLLFTALTITTATNTALIESIGPTITTILAFLFIGERLSAFGWLGIFISCLGAVCIVSQGSLSLLLALDFNEVDILVVISESMWSIYVVVSWKLTRDIKASQVTAWTSIIGGLFCLILGALSGSLYYEDLTFESWVSFIYLVVASGIFAFIAWNYAVTKVGATKAGAFVYLVPLAGAVIGVSLLDENISLGQILGGVIIVLGMLITVKAKLTLSSNK
ncbi:MAG: EamA family transporter [Succinatimonas sp.]|nr:EamA family transporter [Succinatimonas sp.]